MTYEKEFALRLLEEGAACVAVRGEQVLGSRSGRGLRPLYELTKSLGSQLEGAFVADRVIGKAAALLVIDHHVRACYGQLMSDGAIEVLENSGIEVDWGTRVPHILARNAKDDWPEEEKLCPMERLVAAATDEADALERLNAVLSGQRPLIEYVHPKRNESH